MKTREELKKEFEETFIGANMETLSSQKGEHLWNWIQQAITEAKEQTLKEVESIIIGKDDVPIPEYRRRILNRMGWHDDIYKHDWTVKTNNLLRHEQRSRLKKLSQQEV